MLSFWCISVVLRMNCRPYCRVSTVRAQGNQAVEGFNFQSAPCTRAPRGLNPPGRLWLGVRQGRLSTYSFFFFLFLILPIFLRWSYSLFIISMYFTSPRRGGFGSLAKVTYTGKSTLKAVGLLALHRLPGACHAHSWRSSGCRVLTSLQHHGSEKFGPPALGRRRKARDRLRACLRSCRRQSRELHLSCSAPRFFS